MFLGSCSDNDNNEDGNFIALEFTPNDYKVKADAGSFEIKTKGVKAENWKIHFIRSTEGKVEKFYYPEKDFSNVANGLMDINIDWFKIHKSESGDNFYIDIKENDKNQERKLDIRFIIANSYTPTFTLTQEKENK
ncbi:MAG TPA: hypothetical protein DIT04_14200 [Dysgonomonas sp.]|nr:hypothetical protein [Dysgonomonas sp.]